MIALTHRRHLYPNLRRSQLLFDVPTVARSYELSEQYTAFNVDRLFFYDIRFCVCSKELKDDVLVQVGYCYIRTQPPTLQGCPTDLLTLSKNGKRNLLKDLESVRRTIKSMIKMYHHHYCGFAVPLYRQDNSMTCASLLSTIM